MRKLMTLVLVQKPGQILLGMKKRGFGAGRWNGFGGKVHEGESIVDAARREMCEEASVEVHDLVERGVINFSFEGKEGVLEVHIFSTSNMVGDPVESEEMKPQWYAIDAVPFDEMWPDDRHWLPHFLDGKNIEGRFHFGDGDVILEQELTIV